MSQLQNFEPEFSLVGFLHDYGQSRDELTPRPASTGRPMIRRHARSGSQQLRPHQPRQRVIAKPEA
jgi:hypothetical protein